MKVRTKLYGCASFKKITKDIYSLLILLPEIPASVDYVNPIAKVCHIRTILLTQDKSANVRFQKLKANSSGWVLFSELINKIAILPILTREISLTEYSKALLLCKHGTGLQCKFCILSHEGRCYVMMCQPPPTAWNVNGRGRQEWNKKWEAEMF